MRILFVTEATGWTGGANQVWLTSQELKHRGHHVVTACPPDGELSRRLSEVSIETKDFEPVQDYDLFCAWRLSETIQELAPHVVHAHHSRAHAMTWLASYLKPFPLVVTRRVIFPIRRNPFSRWKYVSHRITRYIGVCQAAADELAGVGVQRGRIRVIPSGVEMDRYEASRRMRESCDGRPPFCVIMVGNHGPAKGYEVFLRAVSLVVKEVPEARFRLVGRDTELLEGLIGSMGIKEYVEILGYRRDVPELLGQAHVYAMPSLMEGTGTALIEAQSAMVPVVASEVGGLPEVVDKDKTGLLVPPGDEKALAAGIVHLLRHPQQARTMARQGYERVRQRYSLESVVNSLEALYQELAS